MIAWILVACATPTTVQPLVAARAEEIGVAAGPGLRLGVAAGSLAAWLCSLEQSDLRELAVEPVGEGTDTGGAPTWTPTIDAPSGFASNLGVTEPGSYYFNNETGVATMTYLGSLDEGQALSIDVVVDTPTQEFTLLIRAADDGALSATAEVSVDGCAVTPQITVEMDLEDGDQAIRIVLPGSDGVPMEWAPPVFEPRSGTASWSTGTGVNKLNWQADSATELDGALWPGTASSADWASDAAVSIARPD